MWSTTGRGLHLALCFASCDWYGVRVLLLITLVAGTSSGSAPLAWTYMTGNYSWAVAVSLDGRFVVAGSDDMHTYFFETSLGGSKPLWSHETHGYVRHVSVSRNGACIAAGDTEGNIFFYRSNSSGGPVWSYRSETAIQALALTDLGDYLAAGDRRGHLYVLKTDLQEPMIWQYLISGGVLAVSLSTHGVLVATGAQGGLYFFGQVTSPSYEWAFQQYSSLPYVAITDDGSYLVAGGSDGYLYLLTNSGQLVDRSNVGGAVSALSISVGTRRVVAGTMNGNVSLYQIENRLEKRGSFQSREPVTSIAASENGDRVSVAYLDGEISTFDGILDHQMWSYNVGAIVHSLSVSGNGRVMAAASDTGGIYLFNEEIRVSVDRTGWDVVVLSVSGAVLVVAYFAWRRRVTLRQRL